MLEERELYEARQLFTRIQHGSVSREDWSDLAALVLMAQPTDVLIAIASDGFDRFVTVSTQIYDGHAFVYADYRHIFDRVCQAAARGHGQAS
jgi:hypothetical protein